MGGIGSSDDKALVPGGRGPVARDIADSLLHIVHSVVYGYCDILRNWGLSVVTDLQWVEKRSFFGRKFSSCGGV